MYEDILNFPKKVVELGGWGGGGGQGRKANVIFNTCMSTYDSWALSLRIEEEKECLIYIFFFHRPPSTPLFKYIN